MLGGWLYVSVALPMLTNMVASWQEQLKKAGASMALEKASQAEAQAKARAHQAQQERQRREKEKAETNPDQVFEQAMSRLGAADVVRKFDAQLPPDSADQSTATSHQPADPDDAFLAAVKRLGP